MVFSMDPEHPQAIGELLGELIGSGFQNLPKREQYTAFTGREAFFRGQPAEHIGPQHSESLWGQGLRSISQVALTLVFRELEHSLAII